MTELFNEIANAEQVSLSLDIKGDNSIQANSSLVQVLITNLISNGIHYNYKGGELKIVLQGNTLQVANTSKTEELDENIIFRRFVRKSVDNTGSGLGLAIVDLICKFHKWEIHYRYDNRFHNFVVDFTPQITIDKVKEAAINDRTETLPNSIPANYFDYAHKKDLAAQFAN